MLQDLQVTTAVRTNIVQWEPRLAILDQDGRYTGWFWWNDRDDAPPELAVSAEGIPPMGFHYPEFLQLNVGSWSYTGPTEMPEPAPMVDPAIELNERKHRIVEILSTPLTPEAIRELAEFAIY